MGINLKDALNGPLKNVPGSIASAPKTPPNSIFFVPPGELKKVPAELIPKDIIVGPKGTFYKYVDPNLAAKSVTSTLTMEKGLQLLRTGIKSVTLVAGIDLLQDWARIDNVVGAQGILARDALQDALFDPTEEKQAFALEMILKYQQLAKETHETVSGQWSQIGMDALFGVSFLDVTRRKKEEADTFMKRFALITSSDKESTELQEERRRVSVERQIRLDTAINKTEGFTDRDSYLRSLVSRGVDISDQSALERFFQKNPSEKEQFERLELSAEAEKIKRESDLEAKAMEEPAKEEPAQGGETFRLPEEGESISSGGAPRAQFTTKPTSEPLPAPATGKAPKPIGTPSEVGRFIGSGPYSYLEEEEKKGENLNGNSNTQSSVVTGI